MWCRRSADVRIRLGGEHRAKDHRARRRAGPVPGRLRRIAARDRQRPLQHLSVRCGRVHVGDADGDLDQQPHPDGHLDQQRPCTGDLDQQPHGAGHRNADSGVVPLRATVAVRLGRGRRAVAAGGRVGRSPALAPGRRAGRPGPSPGRTSASPRSTAWWAGRSGTTTRASASATPRRAAAPAPPPCSTWCGSAPDPTSRGRSSAPTTATSPLTRPRYGSTVTGTVTVGGRISGVDESIRVTPGSRAARWGPSAACRPAVRKGRQKKGAGWLSGCHRTTRSEVAR